MDGLDGSPAQVIGGALLLVLLFVVREFVSGALRQAGEDAWVRTRKRRKPKCPPTQQPPTKQEDEHLARRPCRTR